MNEQKITQEIAQTITEQPVKFSIKTRGFLKLFIKKINLNLHDLHCDTLYKISPLLLSLKLDKEATGMDIAYRAIEQHAKTQFKIITIAILDSRWTILKPLLFRFLFHNLTSTELKTLVELVISRMEVVDFINANREINIVGH